MESILIALLEKIGIPVLGLVAVWLAGKYFKPVVDKWSKPTAEAVALIVDELLTILVAAFPDAKWDDILAMLIRQIMDKLGLNEKNATDIAQAAMLKRGLKPVNPDMLKLRPLSGEIARIR